MKFKHKGKKYRTRKWVNYIAVSLIANIIIWWYVIYYLPI